MPIGASDYATNWYSLDDTPDDFALKHFNLDRDLTSLIPYIKAAMKFQPDLQIWGSPWSPPVWMKVNQTYNATGTNQFIQEENYLSTYAFYLAKFVQAYQAEGISVFAVAVQNEPFASQVFPSCTWTPAELRDFIGKYVGPAFDREKVAAQIWLGTFNNNQFSAFDTSLADPVAAKYISAVGLQWAGKNALPEINAKYPNLQKIETESECGDGSFDWKAAEYTFSLMKHYLNHGVSVYSYWNMILDETGKSTWGWNQNALVSVNQNTKQVSYTPEFYLFRHFSHFVPKGSVKLKSYGNFDDAIAFCDVGGKVVLIAVNSQLECRSVNIKIGGRSLNVNLPARSFNTFRFSPD
jgi:glucosylceramidase